MPAPLGVGPTRDVVLVHGRVTERVDDATADAQMEHTGFDARTQPGDSRVPARDADRDPRVA
ncbi:MAG: hypothetical protein M3292_10725 [Actinomycetota bacterium]|nr:hypothetical protein [Actinomycetota bacterium]